MPIFEKHFTVAEARRELPQLRRQFARIHALMETLQQAKMEVERIQNLVQSNGNASRQPDFSPEIAELQQIVHEIISQGIEIKDLERGLIDFPHWRRGEEVLLCWLVGEEDIFYWHTLEGGFSGRTPL